MPRLRPKYLSARPRRLAWAGLVLGLAFFGVGFALSDAVFFKRLVRQNSIAQPDDAWQFLETRIHPPKPGTKPVVGLSARYMLEVQKGLYCDEGALLMATMLREAGHKSRLVDLHGSDKISHHTVLEVEEPGGWKVYDTLVRKRHGTLEESARACDFELAYPVRRPTWSLYRSAVYYNFFVKSAIFKMRGLPG